MEVRARAGWGDADLASGLGPASLVLLVLLLTNGTLSVMLTNPGLSGAEGRQLRAEQVCHHRPLLLECPVEPLLVSPQPMQEEQQDVGAEGHWD